jgi:hypothetical protein
VAKNRQQKKKEREKRVAKQKLADAAKRREVARQSDQSSTKTTGAARGSKVMTAGVRQQAQQPTFKPTNVPRRTGG